jgi:hypothetical protein
MSLLDSLSFKAEKTFARGLVEQLTKELPPTLMEKKRKVLSVNKVTRLLERTYQTVGEYQSKHQTGFVKRALIANTFKWELKNAGYPDDFVDMATEGLVVEISNVKKASKTE